jgi:hypothetical protein
VSLVEYRQGYKLDALGFDSWHGQDIFLISETLLAALGSAEPLVQWVWTIHLCPVLHLMRGGSCASVPSIVLCGMHRKNFVLNMRD